MICPFCTKEIDAKIIAEYGAVFALEDSYPVAKGHVLILPRRHAADFFSMTSDEVRDTEHLLRLLRERLLCEDVTITGFNVGINCGISAPIFLTLSSSMEMSCPSGVAAATAGRERAMIWDHLDRDLTAADISFIFMIAPHRMVS